MKHNFIYYLTNLDQILNSESNVWTKKLVYVRDLHISFFTTTTSGGDYDNHIIS